MRFAFSHGAIRPIVLSLAAAGAAGQPALGGDLGIHFSHVLSDFNGPVRVGAARAAIDAESGEVLVASGRDVRVFNDVGMQVYGFRTSGKQGGILDFVVDGEGRILTLTEDLEAPGDRPRVFLTRHDFRGVRLGELEITGLPPEYADFVPNRLILRGDRLYLASTTKWLAMVAGIDGSFVQGYNFADVLKIPLDERESKEITGFDVDAAGNFLFTCSMLFRAYVVSPDGEILAEWGSPGSTPGTFGVVAGIARDGAGRTFVTDKSRGVVMIFDANYQFLTEFGGDPTQDGGALGRPMDVVPDGRGRLYVIQLARRGVVAYDLRAN